MGDTEDADVAEMRKLRWLCVVTKLAMIGHEIITGTMELGEIFGESLEKEIEMVRAFDDMRLRLSHCHTGSYDCLIVRSVAMWRTCDRSAMFATIASSDRILRCVFLPGGRSPYDWSYAWSRDQHRLEKIIRLVVVINDRSYDRSWPPTIDRMINSVGL